MNTNFTESDWAEWRDTVSRAAEASKSSHSALEAIFEAYRGFSTDHRNVVDAWMRRALLGDDEAARFDALALVREFRVQSALPELRILADALEQETSPSAPFDWAKVNRLIGYLTAES